jgi:hypothetical protein
MVGFGPDLILFCVTKHALAFKEVLCCLTGRDLDALGTRDVSPKV